jgi:hypothetical protein
LACLRRHGSLGANLTEVTAFVCLLAAFEKAPTYGHVAVLSGLQSIFCFLIAIPLGRLWPQFYTPVTFDREHADADRNDYVLVSIMLAR